MIAADLVAELESRFRCVDGPHRAICQTNEPYVMFNILAPTEDEGCQRALDAFRAYEDDWRKANPGQHPVLYWRFAPQERIMWEWHEDKRLLRGRIYTRFCLSCRPVVELDDDAYDAQRTEELEREHFGSKIDVC